MTLYQAQLLEALSFWIALSIGGGLLSWTIYHKVYSQTKKS